ncbi:hypothetical protein RHMOL_Rhmol02G0041700 [Rhododendron molle]|uniref:Uncharacterized protein n=1 Tax=Rhododendron molle TaxID=49168 RepID=A0ACC0PMS8_RHOML|nr:hypothetical protein RHMOL_Rhmol02G0041700 [Rhododendron molle]
MVPFRSTGSCSAFPALQGYEIHVKQGEPSSKEWLKAENSYRSGAASARSSRQKNGGWKTKTGYLGNTTCGQLIVSQLDHPQFQLLLMGMMRQPHLVDLASDGSRNNHRLLLTWVDSTITLR